MIDGCTRFGAFMRVVLPLSLPGLTSAFVLNAILGWSQFIIPFILLSRPNLLPIAVGIFNFQGTYNQTSTQILAAASVLSIVPAIVVFLVAAALHHRRPDGRRGEGLMTSVPRAIAHAIGVPMRVHMIGNAHIDPVWLWPWQAGADEALATTARGGRPLRRVSGVRLHPRRGLALPAGRAAAPRALRPHPQAGRARAVAHHRRPVHPARPEPADRRRAAPPDRRTASATSATGSASRRRSATTSTASATPRACPTSSPRTATPATSSAGRSSTRWRLPANTFVWRGIGGAEVVAFRIDPGLRRELRRPDRAGEDRRRERRSGARPHHVLLRRRQPRRRPVEGDDRMDPRAPHDASTATSSSSRRRRRSSRRSPTSAICCRVSRVELQHTFPGCYSVMHDIKSAQRHGEQLLVQAERAATALAADDAERDD